MTWTVYYQTLLRRKARKIPSHSLRCTMVTVCHVRLHQRATLQTTIKGPSHPVGDSVTHYKAFLNVLMMKCFSHLQVSKPFFPSCTSCMLSYDSSGSSGHFSLMSCTWRNLSKKCCNGCLLCGMVCQAPV